MRGTETHDTDDRRRDSDRRLRYLAVDGARLKVALGVISSLQSRFLYPVNKPSVFLGDGQIKRRLALNSRLVVTTQLRKA